jgi:hypothetical protein
MSIVPFAVIWACLVMIVLGLAAYRKMVSLHEDDFIHVAEGEAKAIPQQIAVAHKLEVLDHWGKILTIVAAVSGLLLGCVYLYMLWQQSLRPVG